MPTRQHIRCYECGYEYDLTGRMASTHCPKCKGPLDLAGYTIDADCRESLKTLGPIKVTARGVLNGARLLATDIEMAGRATGGSMEAFRRVTIFPGAEFPRRDFKTPDLRIEPGAEVTLRASALYRDVDIAGTFKATLYSNGLVTVRAGGCFQGALYGGRLVVEDGATLLGEFCVGPEGLEKVSRMQEQVAAVGASGDSEQIVAVVVQPPPAAS